MFPLWLSVFPQRRPDQVHRASGPTERRGGAGRGLRAAGGAAAWACLGPAGLRGVAASVCYQLDGARLTSLEEAADRHESIQCVAVWPPLAHFHYEYAPHPPPQPRGPAGPSRLQRCIAQSPEMRGPNQISGNIVPRRGRRVGPPGPAGAHSIASLGRAGPGRATRRHVVKSFPSHPRRWQRWQRWLAAPRDTPLR